jgi:nucleoside-diphosphate-sugar epimerase
MRVLVTGGTGSVGINIVRRLAQDGHDVLCVSRRGREADPARDAFLAPVSNRVTLAAGDLALAGVIERMWDEYRPSHVVHAAAVTPTREMERTMTRAIVAANLMGTVNVLDASRRGGVRRVVYVSSAAVYGQTPEDRPIPEEAPLHAWGLYGITKEASEKLCAYYHELHGISTASIRVGWVYGPMERPMPGSRHTMSLVFHCVRLALAGEEIRLAHLDHVRDWIYADDLARAVGALLERDYTAHDVYNCAGGRGYTHRELLDTLGRVIPLTYRQVDDPDKANIPSALTRARRGPLSTQRLLAVTSYRPNVDLEAGLRLYVRWVKEAGPELITER